jgi:membrane-bound lytic murein transglycosylase B
MSFFRSPTAAAIASVLILAGCQTTAQTPPVGGSEASASASVPAPTRPFPEWVAAFREDALKQGISPAVFDRAFAGVQPSDRVIELDRSQPEFNRQVWQYLDSAASAQRVQNGRAKIKASEALLRRVSARTGVPVEILIAEWGIETDYGAETGGFPVIKALATLAYEGRRAAYFRDELLAALTILQAGDIPLARMDGSWAGAMGQTQFMPTIFLKNAVDEDGDGRRDIWGSLPDVFASTAKFVLANGWRPGEGWGQEVRLPDGFPYDQAELNVTKPIAEWGQLGVRTFDGQPVSGSGDASILVLAGHTGPAFLVTENFRAIMRYNPSTSYALAVAILADKLAGKPGVRGEWPRQERALTQAERSELQQRLTDRGYAPGSVDGIVGANTRNALRRFQVAIGEVPDGFATVSLLDRLRAQN